MGAKTTAVPSARERLLTAANELFYAEGVHTVGIDRVIERAGVAKASLYNTFGSKDELVRVYLEGGRRGAARRGARRRPGRTAVTGRRLAVGRPRPASRYALIRPRGRPQAIRNVRGQTRPARRSRIVGRADDKL